MKALEDAETA